jgi:uncharacterized SAM-binding protein YcdF (DUF218 family)
MDTVFFVASKIAWALIRTESWLLLILLWAALAMWRDRRRTAGACLGLALAGLTAIGVFPLGSLLLRPLETRYPANPPLHAVAGIVVLGGGEDAQRSALWGQPLVNDGGDRFLAALGLANRFPDAVVVFTGGIGSLDQSGPTGADVARQLFLSAGLAPGRLVLEAASRNTAENAQNALELREGGGEGAWLLVTSAFHMPRAVATFCAAGWTDLVPWPTDFRGQGFRTGIEWDLASHLSDLNTALREWVGLAAYRLTGRAADPATPGCLAGDPT